MIEVLIGVGLGVALTCLAGLIVFKPQQTFIVKELKYCCGPRVCTVIEYTEPTAKIPLKIEELPNSRYRVYADKMFWELCSQVSGVVWFEDYKSADLGHFDFKVDPRFDAEEVVAAITEICTTKP